jgi:uncharacterized protein YecT (DUF1311 family)
MRMLGLTLAILIAAATMGAAQQKKNPKTPPKDDACGSPVTQADMNDCAARNLKKADAALDKAYGSLLKALDEDHAPILQKSQKAWEKYRAAECELQSSQFLGGSAQAQLYADCLSAMAGDRANALKDTRKTLADFISR